MRLFSYALEDNSIFIGPYNETLFDLSRDANPLSDDEAALLSEMYIFEFTTKQYQLV